MTVEWGGLPWVTWVFAVATVICAGASVFSHRRRSSAILLQFSGVFLGGIYLSLGSELMAFAQWICSGALGLVLLFYVSLVGDQAEEARWGRRGLALLVSLAFGCVLIFGTRELPASRNETPLSLGDLGRSMVREHFVATSGLLVLLLILAVGAGMIARPRKEDEGEAC